jgi:hypothetical protein
MFKLLIEGEATSMMLHTGYYSFKLLLHLSNKNVIFGKAFVNPVL